MVVYIHGYIGDSLQMNELNFNLHSIHSTVVSQTSFLLVAVSCPAGWIYSQRNISAWHKAIEHYTVEHCAQTFFPPVNCKRD